MCVKVGQNINRAVGGGKAEEVARPGQDLPPPIFAPSQHQQPPPVLQSNSQGQSQRREEEHKMEEVVAYVLCKNPVVECNPYSLHLQEEHNSTLDEIFKEGAS